MQHTSDLRSVLSDTSDTINSKRQNSVSTTLSQHRVNWHEAALCAIQIELNIYSNILEYQSEYLLGKNNYRIDLLVIKKLSEIKIIKNIAQIFKTFNLFEIKGLGSSVDKDAYYKTIGYAGLFINQTGSKNQYSSLDITLSFLSHHYPRKLITHLRKERKIIVEKSSPGIYHINKETFDTQIIVTKELLSEQNLYLRCLTNRLQNTRLVNQLVDDYKLHQEQNIYIKYMHQLTIANSKPKGDSPMICEGILNLCGTSSAEIIERTKKKMLHIICLKSTFYRLKMNI